MKNYLKIYLSQNKLLFNILANPIRIYITKLKLKIMEKKLSELLERLTAIKHKEITEVQLLDDRLFFRFYGGKFYVIKEILMDNPENGYLKVYHDTPVVKDNMKHVEDFFMMIDKFGHVSITNYIVSPMNEYLQTFTNSSMVNVLADEVPNSFMKQLEAKLKKDKFAINPIK